MLIKRTMIYGCAKSTKNNINLGCGCDAAGSNRIFTAHVHMSSCRFEFPIIDHQSNQGNLLRVNTLARTGIDIIARVVNDKVV